VTCQVREPSDQDRGFSGDSSVRGTLATLNLEWVIVQPAFLYGLDGVSSRMLRQIASLPLLPVPGSGEQSIQPIHIDDLFSRWCASW
jgi:hypothetical protein